MTAKKERYERVEVRFNKSSELDIKLYKHLEECGLIVGKHNYLMQLLYEDYKKKAAEK